MLYNFIAHTHNHSPTHLKERKEEEKQAKVKNPNE